METVPKIHVTGIVLGSHESDDVKKTETYCFDLATLGGGICRFLVDDSYQTITKHATLLRGERNSINPFIGAGWQMISLFSFLSLCGTIYITEYYTKYTGRRTYLDMMTMIPTFLQPDPSIYRFWTVALCLQAVMVLQLLKIPLCCRKNKNKNTSTTIVNTSEIKEGKERKEGEEMKQGKQASTNTDKKKKGEKGGGKTRRNKKKRKRKSNTRRKKAPKNPKTNHILSQNNIKREKQQQQNKNKNKNKEGNQKVQLYSWGSWGCCRGKYRYCMSLQVCGCCLYKVNYC